MPKLVRWTCTGLALVLFGSSCTNDYEQFDFGAGPKGGSAGQGGTAGAAQGSGGQAGTGPDGSIADSGGGDAQAGTSGGGTAGTTGSGGTSGAGTGGQVGSDGGGTGGTGGACGQFQILCGPTCVDGRTRGNCGACDNDCEQQGLSGGFQCIDMHCGCTMSSQCGSNPSARCSMLAARCVCDNDQCQAGERCSMTSGNCTCNGGPACDEGQICCQSSGCRTGSCE